MQIQSKDSEVDGAPLCLGNVLKDFSIGDMKKTGLFRYVYDKWIMIALM